MTEYTGTIHNTVLKGRAGILIIISGNMRKILKKSSRYNIEYIQNVPELMSQTVEIDREYCNIFCRKIYERN